MSSGASLPATILADVATPVTTVRLSPSGTAAVLVHDNAIEIVAGLPAQPVVKMPIAKAADLGTIAVSDDGEVIALVDRSGAGWLLKSDSRQQIPATGIRDIEFRAGTHDFLYIEGDVISASGTANAMLAGPADGVSAPRTARPVTYWPVVFYP